MRQQLVNGVNKGAKAAKGISESAQKANKGLLDNIKEKSQQASLKCKKTDPSQSRRSQTTAATTRDGVSRSRCKCLTHRGYRNGWKKYVLLESEAI